MLFVMHTSLRWDLVTGNELADFEEFVPDFDFRRGVDFCSVCVMLSLSSCILYMSGDPRYNS